MHCKGSSVAPHVDPHPIACVIITLIVRETRGTCIGCAQAQGAVDAWQAHFESSTSAQPVKRLSALYSEYPWRTTMSITRGVAAGSSEASLSLAAVLEASSDLIDASSVRSTL